MGAGQFLKEVKPEVQIVGIEPRLGHKVQGLKNMKEAIVPAIYDVTRLDQKLTIDDEDAFAQARQLARSEGIFAGMSSGAAVAGALQVAQGLTSGVIVVILPDRGDRYLSTTLFRSVCGCCPP
jgi:cysteine synthase B